MTTLAYDQRQTPPRADKPTRTVRGALKRARDRISVFMANYSVAMNWSRGLRANPTDLKKAGFTKELEDRVIAGSKGAPAN